MRKRLGLWEQANVTGKEARNSNTQLFLNNKEERVPTVPFQEYRQRKSK
jgi:hypothetical protein